MSQVSSYTRQLGVTVPLARTGRRDRARTGNLILVSTVARAGQGAAPVSRRKLECQSKTQ